MGLIKIKKGLSLPINGKPDQEILNSKSIDFVALLGDDYQGMKPTMEVAVGDSIKLGQVLFTDKKMPDVKYTSPGAGKIKEINRGEKRVFQSIVIELSGNEEITFQACAEGELARLDREKVKQLLLDSGQWTAIRVRPFSKVADPHTIPHSIFITAMDTNPLAPSVEKILKGNEANFKNGLTVLSKLTDGKVFLCKSPGADIPSISSHQISVEEFKGPHPAGNAGTHIHFLDPVSRKKHVWYINAQDVAAIGYLFTIGRIMTERVVSLAGAKVKNPRLIKTRVGASTKALVHGELIDEKSRVISGSVLAGRKAEGPFAFLGRYHQQISVIQEGIERAFLGWMSAGSNLFSIKNIVLSKISPNKSFDFNTALYGGRRAIVPSGGFEAVMPMDIIPTYLLRALAVKDVEEAEKLGMLELDEEDLALCTFVCPSKLEYGPMLRENLSIIEKEG